MSSSSYLENILITEDSAGFSLKHLLEPRLQNLFIPIGLVGNATKQVIQRGGKVPTPGNNLLDNTVFGGTVSDDVFSTFHKNIEHTMKQDK